MSVNCIILCILQTVKDAIKHKSVGHIVGFCSHKDMYCNRKSFHCSKAWVQASCLISLQLLCGATRSDKESCSLSDKLICPTNKGAGGESGTLERSLWKWRGRCERKKHAKDLAWAHWFFWGVFFGFFFSHMHPRGSHQDGQLDPPL